MAPFIQMEALIGRIAPLALLQSDQTECFLFEEMPFSRECIFDCRFWIYFDTIPHGVAYLSAFGFFLGGKLPCILPHPLGNLSLQFSILLQLQKNSDSEQEAS